MMKEQPESRWRADTEWMQSCLRGVCGVCLHVSVRARVCVCVVTCSLITVQKGVGKVKLFAVLEENNVLFPNTSVHF